MISAFIIRYDIYRVNLLLLRLNTKIQQLLRSYYSYKMEDPKSEKKKVPHSAQDLPEEEIGPNPRKLQKVDLYEMLLENIPSGQNYEISYMHRDIVNNIIVSNKNDTIITFSIDGHVKFWKKIFHLIEFQKNFKAHSGLITSSTLSQNHDSLCTVGIDKTLKIFDVLNCDLKAMIKLPFVPSACEFLPREGFDMPLIALSEQKSGKIIVIELQKRDLQLDQLKTEDNILLVSDKLQNEKEKEKKAENNDDKSSFNKLVIRTFNIHRHPIKFIKMNWAYSFCVSIDQRAFLEVWDPSTFDFPTKTKYKCKIQTQFLQLIQQNNIPIGLTISPKGTYVAIFMKDKTIRVFNLITGKSVVSINESIKEITKIQQDSTHERHNEEAIEETQFQKKLGIEKDIEVSKQFLNAPQVEFDECEQFLIYPSFRGIKIYSLKRRQIQRILGKKQHERFIKVVFYQGRVMRNPAGSSTVNGERKAADPTIYCTSFKRQRFYIFSRRSVEIGSESGLVRDIINQKPLKDDPSFKDQIKLIEKQNQVTLHTTVGDITMQLFSQDCPKTCENFIQLCRKGYYNNIIFHRVIKNFMNQSGCPKGDGTGGQSIWGGYFEDQLCPEKHRFDRPYLLAMANRGPNTNGSQFFITVVSCPWLDNKHTVFGRVVRGIETVCQINKIKTDKTQKPLINVKIISTSIR